MLKLKTMQLELTKPNSARRFICGSPIVVITPDAAHYLRESARALKPGGVLVASLHAEPPRGVKFAGREDRIDIAMDHFVAMGRAAGLELQEDLVSLCGQECVVFIRR